MKEKWKDIEGYSGYYQISSLGRVKSLVRQDTKGRNVGGKYLHSSKDKDGYLQIGLCKLGKKKKVKIHRLVAETFIPNPDNKPQVNHKDGDRGNPERHNLEWMTDEENKKHSRESLGNTVEGEKNPQSVLTKERVLEIRRSVLPAKDLAVRFNVCIETIYNVKSYRAWKYLKE